MYERILVAVDGSPVSDLALRQAVGLARESGARLRVVHVVDDAFRYYLGVESADPVALNRSWLEAGLKLLKEADALAAGAGVPCETALLDNEGRRISTAIVADAQAWRADLIVLGSQGRHGLERLLLGSVAEGVLRTAAIATLVVYGAEAGTAAPERPRQAG